MSYPKGFIGRHIGLSHDDEKSILKFLDVSSSYELAQAIIPKDIFKAGLDLPGALSEPDMLAALRKTMNKNKLNQNFIGQGFHPTIMPSVIQRNVFENPGWYTQYTPYQAEISQGRLESLLNFQTMICDLTGLEIANASLLDEPTAAAEAMMMMYYSQKSKPKKQTFLALNGCFPQTLEVLKTRSRALGIQLKIVNREELHADSNLFKESFGILLQNPCSDGEVFDPTSMIEKAKSHGLQTVVAADLMSLVLLKPPGEYGADVVVGSAQRFGVPMGFGGPHAGFFACTTEYKRRLPGRIIGVSQDRRGKPAFRLALQTREQHIRRDRATSNICTAQALLANIAAMYAVYHGPEGLREIASKIAQYAGRFSKAVSKKFQIQHRHFFDGVALRGQANDLREVYNRCLDSGINVFFDGEEIRVFFHEKTSESNFKTLLTCFGFGEGFGDSFEDSFEEGQEKPTPEFMLRDTPILTHPTFNRYHTETSMLRYLKLLENKDLSLTHSMIPLGSCTMKLNGTSEMMPLSWPEVGELHPFCPVDQARGYLEMVEQLEQYLCACTGFSAFSLQPNAGSQGEFAGLLVIKKYHESRGEQHRDVCLIPSSAHGTNPASAVMAGMKVVVVRCDQHGNVDMKDLKAKAETHRDHLAAVMVTYPSTHGVFEDCIRELCEVVHGHGGQVYLDGANMNAQIGLCQPGAFGADVCHLNLHKTFCIPHGGGGPGVGPIGVGSHLAQFLPKKSLEVDTQSVGFVSGTPFGSASILTISWAYIRLMGAQGLQKASETAIVSANYIAKRLDPFYPVLYRGKPGFVAHECIIDLRTISKQSGVNVEDIAKRLIDYGFHAPTMAWPVPGTLMIEPTESESKEELDRFCDAMISIHSEITEIIDGKVDRSNNLLKNAPHVLDDILVDLWDRPYSQKRAVQPNPQAAKFWPTVSRVDNAYGDRNLVCQCLPLDAYSDTVEGT